MTLDSRNNFNEAGCVRDAGVKSWRTRFSLGRKTLLWPFRAAKWHCHSQQRNRFRCFSPLNGLFVSASPNLRQPCVMALLPAAGFNVCVGPSWANKPIPEGWHRRGNLGYGLGGRMQCTTRCGMTAGRQSESRGKTPRAGTSRCEGRAVGLSYAKMGRTPAYEVGRVMLTSKCPQVGLLNPSGSLCGCANRLKRYAGMRMTLSSKGETDKRLWGAVVAAS